MEATSLDWHPLLSDPTRSRLEKPRTCGKTMVIDKGLGLHALEDLLATTAPYIDMIKIGFGTSPLYPKRLLAHKVEMTKAFGIDIYPGGTFLEVAVHGGAVDEYFAMIKEIGFNSIEISDGIIDLDRRRRNELISCALSHGLKVYTEYGKKGWGSTIEASELVETMNEDIRLGAELVTIEGRESGAGVGIFDENGECRDDQIEQVLSQIPGQHILMWEAPQKSQQVHLINRLGPTINLGNVAPQEVLSLEALRRGLRADTFTLAAAAQKFDIETDPAAKTGDSLNLGYEASEWRIDEPLAKVSSLHKPK
ncbi:MULTISPECIES: phosphosulfolactate synthase [unclassified Paenibacillus]|uniref:phosphosulfolactate synthase n=1 Tax=unclassified Paenibacillus TaxID=185978 RepID=UPI00119DBAF4|nr:MULTISPECIES: phosphosulfolactate synthase [Paenibacillaceae]